MDVFREKAFRNALQKIPNEPLVIATLTKSAHTRICTLLRKNNHKTPKERILLLFPSVARKLREKRINADKYSIPELCSIFRKTLGNPQALFRAEEPSHIISVRSPGSGLQETLFIAVDQTTNHLCIKSLYKKYY